MKNEYVILMKGGLTHWITKEKSDQLQGILGSQGFHGFITIKELGITINTAEVEGVYGQKEYENVLKVKQGMYQCQRQKWHDKKQVCTCEKEYQDNLRHKRDQEIRTEQSKPMSPEQHAEIGKKLKEVREHLTAKGVL